MPSGSMRGPGIMSLVPVAAAAYGIPHAHAWNIGTIGRTEAERPSLKTSGWQTPSAWRTVERFA